MAENIPGDFLIILAFACNILAGLFFFLVARGKQSFENLALKSYHIFTIVTGIALVYLSYLFFTDTYVIKYVYAYSDRSLPFFYTLSALWGGQEGTYLLWLFMNACFGYIIIYKSGQYRNYAMTVFAVVNLFFLFLMVKLSPFAMLSWIPPDGSGLNPLLQDPWMVVHPPVIFVGYSMAGIPFSIAMAALIMKDYTEWVKKSFPWAAITALTLAGGNILGGYWAYKTLGWGGFWAWDPVENSSFIPWFISLAFIHGLIIEKRTGALRKTNLLMAAFVFVLVIYGTFLTRSGVLADFSVHSFVDLGINQYLVVFLVLYLLMSVSFFMMHRINLIFAGLLFFAFIVTTFFTGGNQFVGILITAFILANLVIIIPQQTIIGNEKLSYNIFNREFILFAGMALLFVFSIIVLFWTSLPILTNIFSDTPRAADISTYNAFALPFAIIFSLLLTVAPFANYTSFEIKNLKTKAGLYALISVVVGALLYIFASMSLIFALVFAVVLFSLILFFHKPEHLTKSIPAIIGFVLTVVIAYIVGVHDATYLLFFGMAAMMSVSNLVSIIHHIPSSLKVAGAQISHLGFGFMLIGILASSAFATNEQLILPRGESDTAYGLSIKYDGMENKIEFPQNKLLISYEENGTTYQARPQLYYSKQLDGIMKKPYVKKNILDDIYFSPMQVQDMQNENGYVLAKNKPLDIAGYELTFLNYDMGSTTGEKAGMTVKANIEVKFDDSVSMISPAVWVDSKNPKDYTDQPATFGSSNQYQISIEQILADKGAVAVRIPGMGNDGPPDRLIIDISKKPLINFVWLGTTLILLGSAIVFYRRNAEIA